MIYVDPREGSGDLLDPIKRRVNGQAIHLMMDSGDFSFSGNGPNGDLAIGIERKKIGDMLASMRSGRFAGDQLVKMGRDYDVVYLIIEGYYRPAEDGTMDGYYRGTWRPMTLAAKGQKTRQYFMYSELDKHLISLEQKKNVIVLRSTNENETVWQVVNRYQWWQKPWESHHSTEAIKFQAEVSLFKCSLLRRIAAELPGIGWKRSADVEKHFDTILDMVEAKRNEWASIPGIGEETARKVHDALRRK